MDSLQSVTFESLSFDMPLAAPVVSATPQRDMPELTELLHRYLDPEQVIRCFARAVADKFRFISACYNHQQFKLELGNSPVRGVRYCMQLEHGCHDLGTLEYRFRQLLSVEQLRLLQQLHAKLCQPLFNAWQFASLKTRLDEEPLTGLQNRACFDRQLRQPHTQPLSLLLLDLDHFKNVNDTQGHSCGDRILRQAADLMKSSIRPGDQAFRFGGDEFALLIEADRIDAMQVARRLQQVFRHDPLLSKHGVTASLGLAELQAAEAGSSLFERSDRALYQAKENGRNCLVAA